jgi:hypothetical protein
MAEGRTAGARDPQNDGSPEREAAPGGGEGRSAGRRRARDLLRGSGIVVLIGVVVLAGGLLTWRAAGLEGDAGGGDQRAVLDTTYQQRAQSYARSFLSFENAEFARYRSDKIAAEAFRRAAEGADPDVAARLTEQARSLDALAETRAVRLDYVVGSSPTELRYDTSRRRRDLERQNPYLLDARAVDPDLTLRRSNELHDRSLDLGLAIVVLAGIVLLLTVAEFLKGRQRQVLATLGALAAGVVIIAALVGPAY